MWNDLLMLQDHRPWPPPPRPWLARMRWTEILFAHWPVPAAALRRLVPPGLAIEEFDGTAWVSIVPFNTHQFGPRWLPTPPWLSTFPELNLRTYVNDGRMRGVWFFSLDAGNPLIVEFSRRVLYLAYAKADMSVHLQGEWVDFRSERTDNRFPPALFEARYRSIGEPFRAARGTLGEWLTERYCLYSADRAGNLYRLHVHHGPWTLHSAEAEISRNTIAEAAGFSLPEHPPLLHFSRRIDLLVWYIERV